MIPDVRFAFYKESATKHFGDMLYNGQKSDGLDRTYYGTDQKEADKLVKAARDNSVPYRLERLTYTKYGDELQCKTETLNRFPLPEGKKSRTVSA